MARQLSLVILSAIVAASCSGSGSTTTTAVVTSTLQPPGSTAQSTDTTPATTSPSATPGATGTSAPATSAITTSAPSTSIPPSSAPTTTVTPTSANLPPTVSITAPESASVHRAEFDEGLGWFYATVTFVAEASDADGSVATIEWSSDIDGALGTGPTVTAKLRAVSDSTVTVVTALVTDDAGATGSASIQVVLFVPSG